MILLCSCRESQKDHIEQLVKACYGRIIYYPADLKFCSFKKDSMYNLQMPVREYTIDSLLFQFTYYWMIKRKIYKEKEIIEIDYYQ